jgi:sugar lactone lactonase YvrE
VAPARRALIVATGSHDDTDLRRLRSPGQDAPTLARVLADPAIGDFDVTQVVDQPHYAVAAALEDFFADRRLDDLLVVHLSCHGVKDDDGRLYFAATDTRRRRLASTAVSAAYLNDLMERCRARSIVLLLDCCYSGAFVAGAKGDDGVHLKEKLSGQGRAVLTASNAIEYAWEGDALSGQAEASVFTAAIVDGLETGDADRNRDGVVSIDDLYQHVYERVQESSRSQTPLLWSFGVAGTLQIARNPRPRPADLDAEAPAVPRQPVSADRADRPTGGRSRWRPGLVAGALALALVIAVAATVLWAGNNGNNANNGGDGDAPQGWEVDQPGGVAVGPGGVVYVSETKLSRISTVREDGTITPVAGGNDNQSDYGDGGPATEATLAEPLGVAVSSSGELYIADQFHGTVRRITRDGTITPFAGSGNVGGTQSGDDGGAAVDADLGHPAGVAVADDNTVFVSDLGSHSVWRVDTSGTMTTVAGTGREGFGGDGGPATEATLGHPSGVAIGPDGAVYIADTDNNRIRRVDPDGTITTVAGTGDERFTSDEVPARQSALALPQGVAVDTDGALYIADTNNHRIRKIDREGIITTVAGDGSDGFDGDGGPATEASLSGPQSVAVAPEGTLYIADSGNDRIRRVDADGTITTLP